MATGDYSCSGSLLHWAAARSRPRARVASCIHLLGLKRALLILQGLTQHRRAAACSRGQKCQKISTTKVSAEENCRDCLIPALGKSLPAGGCDLGCHAALCPVAVVQPQRAMRTPGHDPLAPQASLEVVLLLGVPKPAKGKPSLGHLHLLQVLLGGSGGDGDTCPCRTVCRMS